jgi:hypothetical protein
MFARTVGTNDIKEHAGTLLEQKTIVKRDRGFPFARAAHLLKT